MQKQHSKKQDNFWLIKTKGNAMRLGIIAICVLFLTMAYVFEDCWEDRDTLAKLEIQKTKLEIEKLNFELAIYREQESLVVSVD